MRSLLPLLAVPLLVLACRGTPAVPPGAPDGTVARLYAAVDAGDCQKAVAELSASYRDHVESAGCDEFIEKLREFPLERVIETKTDGRDSGARLVRIRVENRKTDVIIRVEAENGQWKIFSM